MPVWKDRCNKLQIDGITWVNGVEMMLTCRNVFQNCDRINLYIFLRKVIFHMEFLLLCFLCLAGVLLFLFVCLFV